MNLLEEVFAALEEVIVRELPSVGIHLTEAISIELTDKAAEVLSTELHGKSWIRPTLVPVATGSRIITHIMLEETRKNE